MKDYIKILERRLQEMIDGRRALQAACDTFDENVHMVVVPVLREMQQRIEHDVFKLKGKMHERRNAEAVDSGIDGRDSSASC